MIETRAPLIEAVATQEPKPLSTAGNSETECERIVSLRVKWDTWRVDRNFVGEGPECRQNTRAANDDSRIRLTDAMQGRALLEIVEPTGIATALQVDERVCENQVIVADVLVITTHVVAELRAAAGEIVGRRSPCCKCDIHEVRGSSHHSTGGASPAQHHLAATNQVVMRARDDEREADRLTRGGRSIGHHLLELRLALHVVERGDRPGHLGGAG